MTSRLLALLALASLTSAPRLAAQAAAGTAACPRPAQLVRNLEQPAAAVRYLADDALEGRRAGSLGERCAGDYIAAEFRRLRLRPLGERGTFFQDVPVAGPLAHAAPHAAGAGAPDTAGLRGRNVLGLLPGRDPARRDEVVVIGAHYDHLGRGGFGSLAPEPQGAVHNGADDNASGVAALLLVAERLRRRPPARSVLFLAFSGEELGLLGSTRFLAQPTLPPERIRAMLNLDMVGRLENDPLLVYGVGTAEEWPAILARANAGGLPLSLLPDGYGPSDHSAFYARDIPVLHFFTNTHDDYHRPSDDWEKIDLDGIRRIAALVEAVAREVADRPGTLALVRGAGRPPQTGAVERGVGAYLGTIPDYTPAEHGMRIGGVRAGSPAEQAGLRAGDVIVRIDEHEIADIYGFTEALRAHQPGDRVRITLLRDGETITLEAVLGARTAGP